jgi:hypothetical protein
MAILFIPFFFIFPQTGGARISKEFVKISFLTRLLKGSDSFSAQAHTKRGLEVVLGYSGLKNPLGLEERRSLPSKIEDHSQGV